ncbi:hypothetical protein SAY87_016067 [Trapa incisa]|uniref:Uncharacterized protein n=1 Tax=Trapa incisa TaxID=236973 RepID=A0AAN7LGB2_9MYRT|nr:hypothetical protein SAY87_016067 [Trapa incisa]
MGFLPCPLPCHSHCHPSIILPPPNCSDDSSSASSSLSSQSSLPSDVPPLTSQPPSSGVAACHLHVATLEGHSSYVSHLALAGESILSASSDGEIRSWSRRRSDGNRHESSSDGCYYDGDVVAVTDSAVKSVAVLGDKLITAHQDHKIRVWKMDGGGSGNPSPTNRIYRSVATLPTLSDRLTRVFSAKNYVEVRRHKKSTWIHHVDAVSALAVSPDHAFIYSVSWDRTLKVWRTSDFKCLESINKAHDDAINAVAVSRPTSQDNLTIYTGSADTKIKVWVRKSADQAHSHVATLEKHRSAVNALALSEDGRALYSGACDRSILVWERGGDDSGGGPFMAVVGALRGHTKAILCLAAVADLVISGSADKTIRVWLRERQGRSYSCLAMMEGHQRPLKCLTAAAIFDEDGTPSGSYMVYSGALDCCVKVWQVWIHPT